MTSVASVILSAQSKKAWVAGAVGALLQPVLDLLIGTEVLTWRVVLVAAISGILGFVAVWTAENAGTGVSAPEAVPLPSAPSQAATPPSSSPTSHLLEAATEDFGGQTVS